MRAIIQRVSQASVSVNGELVSSIGRGLCVLVGISRDDTSKDIEYTVRKILNVKVFEDERKRKWKASVMDGNLEILCVSQFTLYNIMKGNSLDFHLSMGGDQSQEFYNEFLKQLRQAYKPELIKDGVFGAYMQVDIRNDGPVTIQLESPSVKQENTENKKSKENKKKVDPNTSQQASVVQETTEQLQTVSLSESSIK